MTKYYKFMKEFSMLVVGNVILVLSVVMFILPNNILSGGVAGIAVALVPILHVSPELIINVLILGLFVLGSVVLGKDFAFKTVVSSLMYPILLAFFSNMNLGNITDNALLSSLYGGLLAGLGVGIVFRANGSTGGMDVPPLILAKLTGAPVASFVLITDALTICLGLFTFGVEALLIGFISVWSCSFAVNQVLLFGGQKAKSVQIISNAYREIVDKIHLELERGTTIQLAKGGYTDQNRPIILVVISQNQYNRLNQLVHEVDKDAFMIVSDVTEVKGNGFSFDFKV